MKRNYDIFKGNEHLIDQVIDFFLASVINMEKFKEIQTVCLEHDARMNGGKGNTSIIMGHFSMFDFLRYMTHINQVGTGIKLKHVGLLLELLDDELIVLEVGDDVIKSGDKRYHVNTERAKYLYDRGLIKNLVFGFLYITQNYGQSVFKIENIKGKGDDEKIGIGTGFLFRYKKADEAPVSIIITNKHVVEDAEMLKIYDNNDRLIEHRGIISDPKRDLALIELCTDTGFASFHIYQEVKELSEIITIGYPKIPLSKYAYQVYHKGEINSHIEDYFGNRLFLFSAKTSPGNSGGPIIDRTGMVVGIVTEMLFEQEEFFQKGILPYSAGIPGIEIIDFLNKYYLK